MLYEVKNNLRCANLKFTGPSHRTVQLEHYFIHSYGQQPGIY